MIWLLFGQLFISSSGHTGDHVWWVVVGAQLVEQVLSTPEISISVTITGDLLDFGPLFKAFGSN